MAVLGSKTVTMFTDGACRGNPGPSSAGIYFPSTGREIGNYTGIHTNNESEYIALIIGLSHCVSEGVKFLDVYSDSLLMVNQINGIWGCNIPSLENLKTQALELLYCMDNFSLTHVRRELNTVADRICNEVLDEYEGKPTRNFHDSKQSAVGVNGKKVPRRKMKEWE